MWNWVNWNVWNPVGLVWFVPVRLARVVPVRLARVVPVRNVVPVVGSAISVVWEVTVVSCCIPVLTKWTTELIGESSVAFEEVFTNKM